jgi:hypothetical protein
VIIFSMICRVIYSAVDSNILVVIGGIGGFYGAGLV